LGYRIPLQPFDVLYLGSFPLFTHLLKLKIQIVYSDQHSLCLWRLH